MKIKIHIRNYFGLIGICMGVLLTGFQNHEKPPKSFSNVPVLIQVNRENQPDTMGFNLAAQLPEVIYSLVLQNKITLWDSPKKNIQISADALISIEENTRSEFVKSKSIFLNELWGSNPRRSDFYIVGISFMNRTQSGNISYGYIDLEEAAPFFAKEMVKANLNGFIQVNLMEALYSRRYVFNLLQFDRINFRENTALAEQFKKEIFSTNKRIKSLVKLDFKKEIVYNILKNPEIKEGLGMKIFQGFEHLLSENLEIFFELGADPFFDFKTYRSELAITRIEVTEHWHQYKDFIYTYPLSLTLYVNNKKLKPLSIQELNAMKTTIQLKSVYDVLQEKNFNYNLVRINRTYLAEEEAPFFLKALKDYSWTQLSTYVKYLETN